MTQLIKIVPNKYFIIISSLAMLIMVNIFAFFIFPPNYGWWKVYAYLHESGLSLYKDINIAYTPLFVLFQAFLRQISDLVILSTVFGLCMAIALWVVAFLILRLRFSVFTSSVSAVVPLMIWASVGCYLPDDYHSFVNLAVALAFFCFCLTTQRDYVLPKNVCLIFLACFFSVFSFYVKQNIGLVLMVFMAIGYLYYDIIQIRKKRFSFFIFYTFVCSLLFVVFLYILPMDFNDILAVTIKNDAKGNKVTILTNILTRRENLNIIVISFIIFIFARFFILKNSLISTTYNKIIDYVLRKFGFESDVPWRKFVEVIFWLIILIAYLRYYKNSAHISIYLSCAYVFYIFFEKVYKQKPYFSFVFPLAGQIYSSTMTAGFDNANTFIASSLCIATIINFFESKYVSYGNKYLLLFYHFVYLIVVLVFLPIFYVTVNTPYDWWGLKQSNVIYSNYDLPYKQLKYYKVDKNTRDFFVKVKDAIDKYSVRDNDVYLFPHIPIFYLLHNKIPPTKNIVQWFDVITNKNIKKEIEVLKSHQPKVVIMLDPSWFVYQGHSALKRDYLYQQDFVEYMEEMASSGQYKLITYQLFDNLLDKYPSGESQRIKNRDIIIKNPAVYGKTLKQLYDDGYLDFNFKISSCFSNSCLIEDIEHHPLQKGDVLLIEAGGNNIERIHLLLGRPYKYQDDRYVLKIYIRSQ